jgi:hypothetical protein
MERSMFAFIKDSSQRVRLDGRQNASPLCTPTLDIYESTKSVLEFFYPRMIACGIIISHGLATAPNLRRAFSEFFDERDEPVLELQGDQAMVVKL